MSKVTGFRQSCVCVCVRDANFAGNDEENYFCQPLICVNTVAWQLPALTAELHHIQTKINFTRQVNFQNRILTHWGRGHLNCLNARYGIFNNFNPLNAELNPISYLLALLAHHFLHVSRIRVKSLTLRLLMSHIYMERLLMFLDHTQWRSTVGRTPLDEWSARRRDL